MARDQGLPPHEAEVLLLHVLEKTWDNRSWLRLNTHADVTDIEARQFSILCQRRLDGVPVAYLTGQREFYGLSLQVDARVLDPRPDTETLVDWALDVLKDSRSPRIADLGTGSGAIALAIKSHKRDARLVAVDSSADALAVAVGNAQHLGLDVTFQHGNWLEPLAVGRSAAEPGFQLIVSNPPYIAEGDSHLPALRHEPMSALVSGPDGLNDIRHIVEQAPHHLAHNGWLLLEHGYDQATAVQTLMQRRGFEAVQSRNDLVGIARCTGGVWRAACEAG